MNAIFTLYLRHFVLVLFDDILVYSPTWALHLEHLTLVLQLLRDHHLVAKRTKCSFGQQQIDYLGHVISGRRLAIDPSKIKVIQQWPVPHNVKAVRSFLGLAGYNRRFIRPYATIAGPLTDLLCHEAFVWTDLSQKAFDMLKQLSSTPVLALPNFAQDFTLETDASGIGIGAVLSQGGHPIAYYSQKLSPRTQKTPTYHCEMFAITQSVAKWRQYLLGRRFTIITDQQSLKNLTE